MPVSGCFRSVNFAVYRKLPWPSAPLPAIDVNHNQKRRKCRMQVPGKMLEE